MARYNFSLRRILVSVGLISVGMAMIACVLRRDAFNLSLDDAIVLSNGGGALVGAGLFHPFRLWGLGAVIGAIVQLAIGFYLVTQSPF